MRRLRRTETANVLRSSTRHTYLCAVHDWQPGLPGRLMHLCYPAKAIVIGDPKRGVAKLGCKLNHLCGVRGPVEEAHICVAV